VRSYDPDTGILLWQARGLLAQLDADSVSDHGLLYIASGYPGDTLRPVYAIRPGASGDITLKDGETSSEFVVWYNRNLAPYMASSLVYGDYHYSMLVTGFPAVAITRRPGSGSMAGSVSTGRHEPISRPRRSRTTGRSS